MTQINRELKMLYYLSDRPNRLIKIQELADYLEVSPRQIRRYRDDLLDAEINIKHKTGIDGGYYVEKKLDGLLSFSEMECIMINLSVNSSASLLSHLNDAVKIGSKMKENLVLNQEMSEYNLEIMTIITKAIIDLKKIKFTYIDKHGEIEVISNPYCFIKVHESYYLRALNQDIIKTYDVSKMSLVKISEDSFILDEKLYQHEIKDSKECYGIYRYPKEEPYEIKLRIKDEVKQDILRYFDYKGTFKDNIYEVKCYNLREILPCVLSLGSKVEHIEPASLYYLYKEELNKMLK